MWLPGPPPVAESLYDVWFDVPLRVSAAEMKWFFLGSPLAPGIPQKCIFLLSHIPLQAFATPPLFFPRGVLHAACAPSTFS